MKIILNPTTIIFTPATNQIDFSLVSGFQPYNLYAVINITTEKLVYSVASGPAGYGGSFSGSVLTYDSSNAGQSPSDVLQCIYEDTSAIQNVSVQGNASTNTFAADGTPILSTFDPLSFEDGLNVNLLNSSFGGQIGSAIPIPNNNNALSMAFLNGSVLAAPKMDPVTNELIVQTSPIALQNVNLTEVNGTGITLGQKVMANSLPVAIASDQNLEVSVGQTVSQDILGVAVGGNRNNQIEVSFNSAPGATLITNSFTGAGSVTVANGHSIYQTGGVGAAASAQAVSVQTTTYRPGHEIYSMFTAAFTDMVLTRSSAKIGLFDANNGFFIGFDTTLGFAIGSRVAGVDTVVDQANFNVDKLLGTSGSKFTRNGSPEAINFAFSNLFRIRFAWLGSANIYFEVFSPDAEWVLFHNIRQPNSAYNPSIQNPNLPMTVLVSKTSGTQNSAVATACWGGGTTSTYQPITSTLNDNSLAAVTRSVITGVTTAGGGNYVNCKVNPSGALVTEATLTSPTPVQTELYITGQQATNATPASGTPGAGTNLLNAAGGTASTDCTGYRTASVQVVSSTINTVINFEYSNDNTNWVNFAVFRPDSASPNAIVSDITTTAGLTAIVYSFPIFARYIRLRLRQAPAVGNTIQAYTRLSTMAWSPTAVNAINSVAANLNANVSGTVNATCSGTVTVTQATPSLLNVTAAVTGASLAQGTTTDINAASVTTSGNSATITLSNAQSASFALVVTVTSGSGTLDVILQEALDGTASPTLWENIYQFERITTATRIYIPAMRLSGTNIRLNYTVTGTVNYAVTLLRTTRQVSAPIFRRLMNRTLDPTTLGSTSGALWVENCDSLDMIVVMNAGGAGPEIQLQGSEDSTNWYDIQTFVTAAVGASTNQGVVDGTIPKWVRARVKTAGAGSSLNYLVLKGKSSG